MKILLIEDDARTAAFILKGLKQAGFTTVHAEDGKTGNIVCPKVARYPF